MSKPTTRRTYQGGTSNPKSPNLGLRLPTPIFEAVREMAIEEDRSMNAQGIRIIRAGLAALGSPVK